MSPTLFQFQTAVDFSLLAWALRSNLRGVSHRLCPDVVDGKPAGINGRTLYRGVTNVRGVCDQQELAAKLNQYSMSDHQEETERCVFVFVCVFVCGEEG